MQRTEREDLHEYDREMQNRNRNLDRNVNLNAPAWRQLRKSPKVPAVLEVQAVRLFHNFKKLQTSLVNTFDASFFAWADVARTSDC